VKRAVAALEVLVALVVVLAFVASLAVGCASSSGANAGGTGYGGATGQGGNGAGTGGTIGSGSGGSSSGAGGAAGGTGAGGSNADAGSNDAGHFPDGGTGTGGAGGNNCAVVITPVSYPYIDMVPAGPSSSLRVRGQITGTPPAMPVWTWTVTIDGSSGPPITVARDANDPSVVEFPVTREGDYRIQATVSTTCRGEQIAHGTFDPRIVYSLRATSDSTDLLPYEGTVDVSTGSPAQQDLSLERGVRVAIEPMTIDSSNQRIAVVSYVRVSSPALSWVREGDTVEPFATYLDPLPSYDLLVVPLPQGSVLPSAPVLLTQRTASQVNAVLMVSQGVTVSGTTTLDGGAAVAGGTVLLRAGVLPSTVATSATDGSFVVRARAGRFSAVILAPDGSPLPDAHFDATATDGIDVADAPAAPPTVAFSWHAGTTTSLTARFSTGAGAAAAGLSVKLDSQDGALPNVGTLRVGTRSFTVPGAVHQRGTTGSDGSVTFTGLPRGAYQLVALPLVGAADGLTATPVDLSGAPASGTSIAVALQPKVAVTGKLTLASCAKQPFPTGTTILVLDDQPELGRAYPPADVAANGTFSIPLDPAHAYHLVAEPPRDAGFSRVPLGAIQTGTANSDQGTRVLPCMTPLTGTIKDGAGVKLSGVLVQVFCVGTGPDCVELGNVGDKNPVPLFEALTDGNGAYSLWVPGPTTN